MDLNTAIQKRKSVRKYVNKKIPREDLDKILNAARLAPSGKNSQNWHYIVIEDQKTKKMLKTIIINKYLDLCENIRKIDEKTSMKVEKFARKFACFFEDAPALVIVMATEYHKSGFNELMYLENDNEELFEILYKRNPSMQTIGASVENMLLEATSLGYGSCWMTSVLLAAKEIEDFLKNNDIFYQKDYFVSAFVSLGIEDGDCVPPAKKSLDDITTFV